MANIQPYFFKDSSGGMATNLNETIAPPNTVALAVNVDFDHEIGSAVSRLGTAIVNAQLEDNKDILGLHNFRDSDSTNHALLGVVNNSGDTNSVVYDVENGTVITGGSLWDSLTASKKARMITFLDSVLLVNGTDAPTSWNGAGNVINTGGAFDLANIPFSEPSLAIEWLDRVYLAGDSSNPDRVYYSSTPSSGAISWTTDNGSIDIEPEDGAGGVTAFGKVPGYLLIFKERSMKRWNFDSAFPETLIEIGTPSQESVIISGGLCAFYSASNKDSKGFYVTNGGRPQALSHDKAKNIKKWVDAIPQANESDIAGIGTDRYYMWSVGDLTVDGVDYKNVVLRYNRKLDQWSVRTYPTEFKFFSSFVESGVNKVVGGDDDGNVLELDKDDTFDDNGTPISWKLHLHEEKFGFNQQKELTEKILWDTKNAASAHSIVFVDGKQVNTPNDKVSRMLSFLLGQKMKGTHFTFGIEGTVDGARAVVKECEVQNITVLQNV